MSERNRAYWAFVTGYFASQKYPISRQLHDGIRALLIDIHYGVKDADENPDADGYRTTTASGGSRSDSLNAVDGRSTLPACASGGLMKSPIK